MQINPGSPPDDEESSQDYDYLTDKIPAYQPQNTQIDTPEKETELSGNVTIEEVRDALVNVIESQPESLRKQTKLQLNLDPNVKLTSKPPNPVFSPEKQFQTTPIKENIDTSPQNSPPKQTPITPTNNQNEA